MMYQGILGGKYMVSLRCWLTGFVLIMLLTVWGISKSEAANGYSTQQPSNCPTMTESLHLYAGFWDWWEDTKIWFSQQASNKTRIVQFGLAGMLLALFILWSASQRKR